MTLTPQLRERGIELPVDKRGNFTSRPGRLAPCSVRGAGSLRADKLFRGGSWDVLAAQLRQSAAPQFVVSDEHLVGGQSAAPQSITRIAASCGRDVQVIAYVRPQCHYFESRYTQRVKRGAEWLPFDAYVGASFALRPFERHPHLNYRRAFARWRTTFGDRLTVVPLEPSRMPEGGLLNHFLALLGVGDLDAGAFKTRQTRPGAKEIEVARLTTAALLRRGGDGHRRARPGMWRKLRPHIRPLVAPDAPFAGFSADEANIIMTRFEAENARFARDYRIDPDGILFRDPVIDDGARQNVASWHGLDDTERAAVRACVRRIVGVDPEPPTGRCRLSSSPRNPPPRLGSARWHVGMLRKPQLLRYWSIRSALAIPEILRGFLRRAVPGLR